MTHGDLTDPFRNDERNGKILPFAKAGPVLVNWKRLLPHDHSAVVEIGARCSRLIAQLSRRHPPGTVIPPHPTHAAMDFALAHLQRDFDLARVLEIDDLTLTAEYVAIVKGIDRVNCTLRTDTVLNLPLRDRSIFARIAARFRS